MLMKGKGKSFCLTWFTATIESFPEHISAGRFGQASFMLSLCFLQTRGKKPVNKNIIFCCFEDDILYLKITKNIRHLKKRNTVILMKNICAF